MQEIQLAGLPNNTQAMKTVITLFFLSLAGTLFSQVPPGATMLNAETGTTYQRINKCTVSEVSVSGQPFTTALRVSVQSDLNNPWDAQVKFPAVAGVREKDVVLVAFYARTIFSPEETGEGQLNAVIEENVSYAKQLYYNISIGQEWKEYYAPVEIQDSIDASAVSYLFHLGYSDQVIEVADVRFLNYQTSLSLEDLPYTEFTYIGQDPDASWRAPARDRIEQFRKGQVELRIFDEQGQALENASVKVEMKQHLFGFGTAIAAHEFNSNPTYRSTVYDMFNEVVFENDLKWPQFNPDASNDHLTRAMDTLEAHLIPVRGHNVIWPSYRFCPEGLEDLKNNPVALRNAIDTRIDQVSSFTRGRLNDWDVMNEPYSEHDLQDVLGDEVMADWFKRVRRNDRNVKLYINDYSILSAGGKNSDHQDYYYEVIQYIDSLGGNIDGIGMQGHFGSDMTSINRVYEILERFAALGKEIKITEHDIDLTQRGVQAEYTRDFMTIVFSHPAVKSLLTWGFWEGRHWKPESAFFEEDWTLRPHGEVWKDMIYTQWWTPEINALSGSQGDLGFDGFLGTYTYTVSYEGKERTGTFVVDQSFQSGEINSIKIFLDEALPEEASITPSQPGFLCKGEEVLLQAPAGEGLEYTWYLNDSPLTQNSSSITTGTGGQYAVKLSKGNVELLSESYVLEVREVPGLELSTSGSLSLCEGDTLTLSTVADSSLAYDWYFGSTRVSGESNILSVNREGSYSLVLTSGACSADTTVEVSMDPRPEVNIEAVGELFFCEGEDVLLRTDPVPGLRYNWSLDGELVLENNFRIRANESGKYHVSTVIGACEGSSDTLEVKVFPLPVAEISMDGEPVFCEGETITLNAHPGDGLAFAWMKGGSLLESTGVSLEVSEEGSYTLVASNEGCSASSDPVLVTILSATDPLCATGLEAYKLGSTAYPNPFRGSFHLQLAAPSKPGMRMELFDARGRLVLEKELEPGTLLEEISVRDPGLYLLKVREKNRSSSIRLTGL
jgi:GH35 family endo-1,4-beta-xylanase